MNWKILGFTAGAIVIINVLLAAILLPFNLGFNAMLDENTTDNTSTVLYKEKADTPTVGTPKVLAETIIEELINKTPTVEGWTIQGGVNTTPVSTALDLTCATPANTVSPAYSRNLSYTNGNPSSGLSVQVNAYNAGQGAKATEEIIKKAENCSEVTISNKNLGYATESFTIEDKGSRDGSGGEGKTVVFRVGDVVGVTAVRGADKTVVDALSKNWYANWGDILTTDICPQQLSTLADASRSPFNSEYKEGWLHRETVTLDDARSLVADIVGRIVLQQNISSGQTSVQDSKALVPSEPLNTSPILEIVKHPETVKVTLPENKPLKPGVPVFPQAPSTFTTEPIVLNDETGPGCGWAFTGQTSPVKDTSKEKENKILDARIAAADKLMEAKSLWWSDKYEYGKAYKVYASQAEVYNNWVKEANKAISKAWWEAYDQSLITYQDKVIAYIEEYTKWKAANPKCSAPENVISSTPAPTTGPVTQDPNCPTPPKAPVRPAQPTIPKPELMPSGAIPAAPATVPSVL